MMSDEQIPPGLNAQARCLLGRPDDVGEQQRREDAIVLQRLVLAGQRPVAAAIARKH
jgi:hypothetical protein